MKRWGAQTQRAMKLREMGWSMKDIAAALGRSENTVKIKLEARYQRMAPGEKRRQYNDEEIATMFEMRHSGMSFRQIGDHFGISKQRVCQLFVYRRKVMAGVPTTRRSRRPVPQHLQPLPQVSDSLAAALASNNLTDEQEAELAATIQEAKAVTLELLERGILSHGERQAG
jgi:uncharacterized alpha-E superfamily protein